MNSCCVVGVVVKKKASCPALNDLFTFLLLFNGVHETFKAQKENDPSLH